MNRIAQIVGVCATMLSSIPVFAQTPTTTNVTMTQDLSRKVTVTYSLDGPAVVTLDIETNVTGRSEWASATARGTWTLPPAGSIRHLGR